MTATLDAPQEMVNVPEESNGQNPTEETRNRGGRPKKAVTEKSTEEVLAGRIESAVRYAIESGFNQEQFTAIVAREYNESDAKIAKRKLNDLVQSKLATASAEDLRAMIAALGG